jgi:hypothetical protein
VKPSATILAVIAVALLAAYYLLGTGYLRARREAADAASGVTAAMQALAQVPLPPSDTTLRLQTAEMDIAAAVAGFPDPDGLTDIVRDILALAGAAGVRAAPLVTQPWTTENLAGIDVPVLSFTVSADGAYADLRAFLAALEADGPPGLVVGDVTMTALNTGDGTAPQFTLDVRAAVYGRPAADGSAQ